MNIFPLTLLTFHSARDFLLIFIKTIFLAHLEGISWEYPHSLARHIFPEVI